MTDSQLNAILTKVQQYVMIDMSNFDTKDEYLALQAEAQVITTELKQLKSEIKGLTFSEAKLIAKQYVQAKV